MLRKISAVIASLAIAVLAGCGGGSDGGDVSPPADFRVVPGDASVIVTWTAEPDVDYWIFFGPGSNINTSNWATQGGVAITGVTSPRIITGLANGVTYSFTINGRKNRGAGGQGAPTQVATPQVAGANWALGTPVGNTRLNSIAAGTLFTGFTVATVGVGGTIFSSVNAGPLTARTNPVANVDLNAVWYGVIGMVAGGPNGTLLHSIDGVTWAQKESGTTATIYGGAAATGSNYIAVGQGGLVLNSTDLTTWTSRNVGDRDLLGATYGGTRFVAVGAAGAMTSSNDGTNWGPSPTLTDRNLRGVAHALLPAADGTFTNNFYVAVGDNGAWLTSTDGGSWTLQTPFTTANLRAITYGGRFVAVGDNGTIYTSINGVDWVLQTSNTTANLYSVARQLTGYTAVGDAGVNVSTF